MKKIGFIHSYQVNNWREIIDNQMKRIIESNIYPELDKIFVGLVGNKDLPAYCVNDQKIEVLYQIDYPPIYEALTLSFIHKLSKEFDGHVFYIHSKGVSRNSPDCQSDWRSLMEHFIIDRWQECVESLKTSDIVGVNWHLGEGYMGASSKHAEGTLVTPHFSGNFWWANTTYIRKLRNIYPLRSKYECEFWIGTGHPRVEELWHTGIHHHRRPYSSASYFGKRSIIKNYIGGKEIGGNEMDLTSIKYQIESFGVDHLPTFGGRFEGGINIQQVPEEISKFIYDLMQHDYFYSNYLEIGAASGGTTYVMNYFLKLKNVAIIDNNKHPKHHLRKKILDGIERKEHIGDSKLEEACNFARNNGPYNIIFIDGDHSYEGVWSDYHNYRHMLAPNGLVVFHDTVVCKGVKKLVDELVYDGVTMFGEYIGQDKQLGITAIY